MVESQFTVLSHDPHSRQKPTRTGLIRRACPLGALPVIRGCVRAPCHLFGIIVGNLVQSFAEDLPGCVVRIDCECFMCRGVDGHGQILPRLKRRARRVSVRRPRRRRHARCQLAQHRSCRSTFPQRPKLRRTAISPSQRTRAVELCDQREAHHVWFWNPAGARAQFPAAWQSSCNGLTPTSHHGRSASATSESNPQAIHRPLRRSSLPPATRSTPQSCSHQSPTTP